MIIIKKINSSEFVGLQLKGTITFKEELIRLQQDPVAYIIAEKERYCGWVDEGDKDWVGQCQEMTELLATTIPSGLTSIGPYSGVELH